MENIDMGKKSDSLLEIMFFNTLNSGKIKEIGRNVYFTFIFGYVSIIYLSTCLLLGFWLILLYNLTFLVV